MKEVKKGWDEFWAEVIGIEIYGDESKAMKFVQFQVAHIIEALQLEKGMRILDAGCGAGFQSVELALRRCEVTGVDISKTLVEFARELAKRMRVNVEFQVNDMRLHSKTTTNGVGRDADIGFSRLYIVL